MLPSCSGGKNKTIAPVTNEEKKQDNKNQYLFGKNSEPFYTVDPKLDDLDIDMKFSAHNFKTKEKMKMTNLNSEKISKISDKDIEVINSVFEKRKDLLEFFNYKIEER